MTSATVNQIRNTARQLSSRGKKWHFHILTPKCNLNKQNSYALILENTSDKEVYVCCSDEPYMDVGKELVKLLHGKDVVKDDKREATNAKPSPQVKKILEKAKQLNNSGKAWHHHMLFPRCMFNKHKDKFIIVFEDKEAGEIIESVSEAEPKGDLQHIETLFYQQKKAR